MQRAGREETGPPETVWVSVPKEPGVEEPGSDRCVAPAPTLCLFHRHLGLSTQPLCPGDNSALHFTLSDCLLSAQRTRAFLELEVTWERLG